MSEQPQDDARDICGIVRERLENGRTIADADVHELVLEIDRLRAENERLQLDCAEAYQAVGEMANVLGWWTMAPDHPRHQPIEKLLDNLNAAAGGEPRPHDDLLPFVLTDDNRPRVGNAHLRVRQRR